MFKSSVRSLAMPAVAVSSLVLATIATSGATTDSPIGTWLDHSGDGAIEIKDCGGSMLCGRVVWLKSAKNAATCNLQIIGGLASAGDGTWGGGWIYDPKAHSKFDLEVTPTSDSKLKILGYAGNKMFSRTMMWTKAPDNLKRCDDTGPAIETAAALPKQAAPNPTAPAADRKDAPSAQAQPISPAKPEAAAPSKVAAARPAPAWTPQSPQSSNAASGSKRHAASAKPATRRSGEVKLAQLGEYGLDDVTLRKSKGTCYLKASDFARVAFPC